MTVLVALLGIIFLITGATGGTIGKASAKIDAFAAGRATFDLVTQRLSQSTLNTYYDYFDSAGRPAGGSYYNPTLPATPPPFTPDHYGRQSNLQFLVKQNAQNAGYGQAAYFVSPQAYSNNADQIATQGLLNACAFYVQYGTDASFSPGYKDKSDTTGIITPTPRFRYRLMQGIEPTESLQVFASVAAGNTNWINNLTYVAGSTSMNKYVAPLADNVIALVVWPRLSEDEDPAGTTLSTDYTYNSQPTTLSAKQAKTDNQLPPNLNVTMVTISEVSARRLDTKSATPPTIVENALQGRFVAVSNYQTDLNAVTAALIASKIDYRVFNTSVPVRESRWSNAQ